MTIENFITRVTNDTWDVSVEQSDSIQIKILGANVAVIADQITVTYKSNASMSFSTAEIQSVNEDEKTIIVDAGGLTFVFEESIF